MELIVNAGDARSVAYKSLSEAKKGNFKVAYQLLQEAEGKANKAHNSQTKLLTAEANGEITGVNLLMVHSQDHLMTTILALELIKELVDMYEKFQLTDLQK